MKEIYIYNSEVEKCSKNKQKIDVIMNHTALHYIVDGYGYFNGVKLGEGEFFCAVQNEKVCYYPERENPWTYVYLDLCGNSMDKVIEKYDFKGENSYGKFDFLDEILEIESLFEIYSKKNIENKPFFNSLAQTLLSLHDTRYKDEKNMKITDIHVKRIREFIEFNFNKKISVGTIAKQFYLSPAYVRNIFCERLGCSPKQYLQDLRMKKAEELLKNTDYKVVEIAVSVGYDDQLAFSKAFKQYSKTSPSLYRKKFSSNE